jgi:hypothetical protein
MEKHGRPARDFGRENARRCNVPAQDFFPPMGREKMEAAGIEPASRNDANDGLYMFSRFFNLDTGADNRQPAPISSRLNLAP